MSTTVNRNISDLKPALQRGLEELKKRFTDEVKSMISKGYLAENISSCYLGISETLRSIERQKELVSEGKSQTMQSNHLTGQAFDFFIQKYPGGQIYPEVLINLVGRIWEDMGGVWGGSWKGFIDADHCEFTGGDKMEWERDVPSNVIKLDPNLTLAVQCDKPSDFAKESWEWAVKQGITDGSRPKDNITREQVVTMIYRCVNNKMI